MEVGMKILLKKSLWLLCLCIPETHASVEEISQFPQFTQMPVDIQAKVISYTEHPEYFLVFENRNINRALKTTFIWARPDSVLTHFFELDKDKREGPVISALEGHAQFFMVKRLLWLSATSDSALLKGIVRGLLVKHAMQGSFSYKDGLIELSRGHPQLDVKVVNDLIRGHLAHGTPMVHSKLMPVKYQEHINDVELIETFALENGMYRMWGIAKQPEVPRLVTVSRPHGEEYVVLNPPQNLKNLAREKIQIRYVDGTDPYWPLAN
jgi:hypothetical protein